LSFGEKNLERLELVLISQEMKRNGLFLTKEPSKIRLGGKTIKLNLRSVMQKKVSELCEIVRIEPNLKP